METKFYTSISFPSSKYQFISTPPFVITRRKLVIISIDWKFYPPYRGSAKNSIQNFFYKWKSEQNKWYFVGNNKWTCHSQVYSFYSANFLARLKLIVPVCSWENSSQGRYAIFMKNAENHGEKDLILLIKPVKNCGYHCYKNI